MPNPVPVPQHPIEVTEAQTDQVEDFVATIAAVMRHGTTGVAAPRRTDATVYPQGLGADAEALTLNTKEKQLFFRQLGVAIAKSFPIGDGVGDGKGLVWRGAWDQDVLYAKDDVVSHDGSTYVALASNVNSAPPSLVWDILAKKGYEPPLPAFTTSLSVSGATVEVGQSVVRPSFSASYNRTPTSAVLSDNQGNAPLNVLATPNSFQSLHSFLKTTADQSVVFYLDAADATGPARGTSAITWRQKAYWGVGTDGQRNSDFIKSLAGKALSSSKARTFTVDANNNTLHLYYAYRAAYGPATFWVGGFEGGFDGPYTVSVTNDFGIVENYYLYQSVQPGLGQTTVTVN